MKVLLLGATGLTGGHCLQGLLAAPEIEQVITLSRRPLTQSHPRLKAVVADFDDLAAAAACFEVDAILCCLGSTLRQAGSKEAFYRIDHDYGLAAARLGKEQGARAFLLMSAVGASPESRVFYNRVKGELERDIAALQYPLLSIYQPGLLLGNRQEHRPGEALLAKVMPLLNLALVGPLSRYRGLASQTVAAAMVNEIRRLPLAGLAGPEIQVCHYRQIQALAKEEK